MGVLEPSAPRSVAHWLVPILHAPSPQQPPGRQSRPGSGGEYFEVHHSRASIVHRRELGRKYREHPSTGISFYLNRDLSTGDFSPWTHRDYGLGTDVGSNNSGAGIYDITGTLPGAGEGKGPSYHWPVELVPRVPQRQQPLPSCAQEFANVALTAKTEDPVEIGADRHRLNFDHRFHRVCTGIGGTVDGIAAGFA